MKIIIIGAYAIGTHLATTMILPLSTTMASGWRRLALILTS